jgi:histidine triad (HIT) family protein
MEDAACVFCRIVNRSVAADIVAEEDEWLAVKDSHPQAPTHLLVIPKAHIPTLSDLTDTHTTLIGQGVHFANRLARAHQITASGYRLVVNCGAGAGQSVWHLHLHLLGGRALRWPPG